jgi:hypothetical protein
MTTPPSREDRDKKFVDSLMSIKDDRFEVWKYFEDRANQLGDRMWSMGTWLMSLVAATLALPFVANFVEVPAGPSFLKINARLPVVVIAGFGVALCVYAFVAILDVRRHIERNWRRAGYARTGQWTPGSWSGGRRHGWNILLIVGILAFVAFLELFVAALLR